MDKHLKTLYKRSSMFDNVQMFSMTDPCTLSTPAFRLIEENFKDSIWQGPTYIWIFAGNLNVKGMLLN